MTFEKRPVCFTFHRRNQDLNKIPGTDLLLRMLARYFFKGPELSGRNLGAEHADWLSSAALVVQPPYSHFFIYVLLLLCHEIYF